MDFGRDLGRFLNEHGSILHRCFGAFSAREGIDETLIRATKEKGERARGSKEAREEKKKRRQERERGKEKSIKGKLA